MNRKNADTAHRTTVTTTACEADRCGDCTNPICQHPCHRPDTARRLGSPTERTNVDRWWRDAAPRASQAAGDANGAGDDAGAAHEPHGGAAGRTALRDSIRDAFHSINPDCVAYHAADCTDCTTRADAVMADIQREFDQHWADLACRTNERDQWRDQVAKEWRQRAEAAEAALATQNAENDRLDQLLIDERAITARLNRELRDLRDQQNGQQT